MATKSYHTSNVVGRVASLHPYHCPRCGTTQTFSSMDSLLLHLQTHHHQTLHTWNKNSMPRPYTMPSYLPQNSSSVGLSPNARELGRQINLARQLTQRQRRAEFRATTLIRDHPMTRPSAHITPIRKDFSGQDPKVKDDSLEKSGALSTRSSHVFSHSALKSNGSPSTSKTHLDGMDTLHKDSSARNGVANQEELIQNWKMQSEIKRLEARLQNKSREVADLRTQVDQSIRVAQDKERNIAELQAFLHNTAQKQSVAKEKLRHYVNDLADRAERAESEVDDLRNTLSPPKTDTSTRSDPKSTGQSTLSSYSRPKSIQHSRDQDKSYEDQGKSVKYSQVSFMEDPQIFQGANIAKSFLGTSLIPNERKVTSSFLDGAQERIVDTGYLQQELSPCGRNNNDDIPSADHIPYGTPGYQGEVVDQAHQSNQMPSVPYASKGYESTHLDKSKASDHIDADSHLDIMKASDFAEVLHPRMTSSNMQAVTPNSNLSSHRNDRSNADVYEIPDYSSAMHPVISSSYTPKTSSCIPKSLSAPGNGNLTAAYQGRTGEKGNLGDGYEDPINWRDMPGNFSAPGNGKLTEDYKSETNRKANFVDGYEDPTDWGDMDFLEDVLEDVLAHRREKEEQERLVEDESEQSDVSLTSESQWSEEGKLERQVKTGKSLYMMQPERRQAALFLAFSYLNTAGRLKCATVCREWRDISRDPELWQYVRLHHRTISSKFLQTISKWCTQLKWLILEKLTPRQRRQGEGQDDYQKKIRGILEPGVEDLLRCAGKNLLTLKVVDCPYILTERVLWLTSCHSRCVRSLTYISSTDPVGPEVLWALGAGCRHIKSLKIPPRQPCTQATKFNSSCIRMISRCWSQLQALSVGGPHVKPETLALVAKSCPKLQVLEFDHMTKLTEERVIPLCHAGLRGLHTLILKHTPITPSAILHFNGACPQLTRISVHLSVSDFFPLPASPGQRKEFSRAIETLLDVSKKRALANVMQVRADYK